MFAVNSFTSHKLQQHQEKVSCTSKINRWIVRRKLNVDPKPIINIAISRKKVGEEGNQFSEESVYDPRAPQDRLLDVHSLNSLYDELMDCAPSSGFFLFHKNDEIEPTEVQDVALNEITILSTNSISKFQPPTSTYSFNTFN